MQRIGAPYIKRSFDRLVVWIDRRKGGNSHASSTINTPASAATMMMVVGSVCFGGASPVGAFFCTGVSMGSVTRGSSAGLFIR